MASQRAVGAGGSRPLSQWKREEGKSLQKNSSNKQQQRTMCRQAEARAAKLRHLHLHKRGEENITRQLRAHRLQYDLKREQLAYVRVQNLRSTCRKTATGRDRKAGLTLLGCRALLPVKPLGEGKVKKQRGYACHCRSAALCSVCLHSRF